MAVVDIPDNTTTTARFDGDPNIFATFVGELETPGDRDWVGVTLTAGTTYRFHASVQTAGVGGGDAFMRLLGPGGVLITSNDDDAGSLNSFIEYTAVATGVHYVEVRSLTGWAGDYGLIATAYLGNRQILTSDHDTFTGDGTTQQVVQGYFGNDMITLGGNTVDAYGEQGDDQITGSAANNYISGGLGNDTITGLGGNDRLFGDSGHDYIDGGEGDDRLYGGQGGDLLIGGLGNDTFFVDVGDTLFENASGGSDRVIITSSFYYLNGSEIELLQTSNQASTAAVNIVGNEFAQTIVGNNGANIMRGEGGADVLRGHGGNDIYYVDSSDTIDETTGNGTLDRVLSSNAFTLAADDDIEYLAAADAGGVTAMNFVGNGVAQTIVGNAGVNILVGHGGRDVLRGLGSADTFSFRAVSDSGLTAGTRDVVADFDDIDGAAGDRIDLTFIDAITGGGNDAFTFVGGNAFNAAGQVRVFVSGGNTIIEGNVDGGLGADFSIELTGVKTLSALDFML